MRFMQGHTFLKLILELERYAVFAKGINATKDVKNSTQIWC